MLGDRKAYKNYQPFTRPEPGTIIQVVNDKSFGYSGKVKVKFDNSAVTDLTAVMGDMGGTPPLQGQRVRVSMDANGQPFVVMIEQAYSPDLATPAQKYDVTEGQQIFQAFSRGEDEEGNLSGHTEVSRILMDNEGMIELNSTLADVNFRLYDYTDNWIVSSTLWMLRASKLGKMVLSAVNLVFTAVEGIALTANTELSATAPTCNLSLVNTNMYGDGINLTLTGNWNVTVDGQINITSPVTNIKGDVMIDGKLDVTDDITGSKNVNATIGVSATNVTASAGVVGASVAAPAMSKGGVPVATMADLPTVTGTGPKGGPLPIP